MSIPRRIQSIVLMAVRKSRSSSLIQDEAIQESLTRSTGLTSTQLDKIVSADKKYRLQHVQLENTLSDAERDSVRRRRMIYRSKQRGWLEVDILLGSWATKYVPHLTCEELDQYEIVLKEETIDIYNFVSGKNSLPDRLQNLSVMKMLQDYALNSGVTDPLSYERIKKEANLT